ncbi:hypothetical protein MAR_006051, partial [Mya arenaria]
NVISESGTATFPFGVDRDHLPATRILAEQLECRTDTNEDIFLCLESVETKRFVDVLENIADNAVLAAQVLFAPSIDGELIVRYYKETIKIPDCDEMKFMRELNYINGVNAHEGAVWVPMLAANQNGSIDDIKVSKAVVSMFMPMMLGSMYPGQNIPSAVSDLIDYEYTNWANPEDSGAMDPNGDGPVTWPKYTLKTMQHLIIDEEDSIGQRLYTKEYQFGRETVPALLQAIENGGHT